MGLGLWKARPEGPGHQADRGADVQMRHGVHDACDVIQDLSPTAGQDPAMRGRRPGPGGLSAWRQSRHQESRGGARDCAMRHAWSVRGAARKAGGTSSGRVGVGSSAVGATGTTARSRCIAQQGQCSNGCAAPGASSGKVESSPAWTHLAPAVLQISTQAAPFSAANAYEIAGASAAARIARTAIHVVSRRATRPVCMAFILWVADDRSHVPTAVWGGTHPPRMRVWPTPSAGMRTMGAAHARDGPGR
jgi:hypothetical protein